MTSPALAALREATQALHAELDQSSPLMRDDLNETRYCDYASRVLGWMRPLEQQLATLDWPSTFGADERWSKSAWLEQDLRAADWSNERLATLLHCPTLPRPDSLAAAFGIAYVTEGATLGGVFLYKRLRERLSGLPLAWLRGYGEHNGVRWQAFQRALAEQVTNATSIGQAQVAAQAAFTSFRDWTSR